MLFSDWILSKMQIYEGDLVIKNFFTGHMGGILSKMQ